MSKTEPNSDIYKIYLEERKLLVENSIKSGELLARTVLNLAAGSFGLSVAFIKDIVPVIDPNTKWILTTAWIGYCVTILFTLVSIYFSQNAYLKQIKIMEETFFPKEPAIKHKNHYNTIVKTLNLLLIISFITGTIGLAMFAILNINK